MRAAVIAASVTLVALSGRIGTAQAARTPQASPARACSGETITTIDIEGRRASSMGVLSPVTGVAPSASRAVRSRLSSTRDYVVRAYLRMRVGDACKEIDLRESERVLRAQPFIASALISATPDGAGRVRVTVDVVDEFPLVVDGSAHGSTPVSLTLGTLNLMGRGLDVRLKGERGFAYRNGVGISVVQYGTLGRPFYVGAGAEWAPRGHALSLEIVDPFLTALQRRAARAGVRQLSDYFGVVRPEGPDVALRVHRASYDIAWLARLGTLDRHHNAGFAGAAVLGEAIRIGGVTTIVSDTGLVELTDPAFDVAYPDIGVARLAAIAGLRSIHFVTVQGFDALTARQDVGVGVQFHVLAGPSVWSKSDGDFFVAGDVYAGTGNERSFASLHVVTESRATSASRWRGTVSSARGAWYQRPSTRTTLVFSVDGASVRKLDFPAQLTFRDVAGGLAGSPNARAAGGSRVVGRLEARRLVGIFRSRADFAVATFADAGKLWAGDVPYGETSKVRGSLGVSLLAAYPRGGKRTIRLDVALPLAAERGGHHVAFRVSIVDRTHLLWAEPQDVSRTRTGAVPANLMKW